MSDTTEVTALLQDWSRGDAAALETLLPRIYDDLRAMARRHMAREPVGHTLEPTALVHEVYFKLMGQNRVHWQNREHFFAIAATLMRRVLVDYAKGKKAEKRGGGLARIPLTQIQELIEKKGTDLVALDQALDRLHELNKRQASVVEMRFYIGLSFEEIAEVLKVSVTTVKRDWNLARLFLFKEIQGE